MANRTLCWTNGSGVGGRFVGGNAPCYIVEGNDGSLETFDMLDSIRELC